MILDNFALSQGLANGASTLATMIISRLNPPAGIVAVVSSSAYAALLAYSPTKMEIVLFFLL